MAHPRIITGVLGLAVNTNREFLITLRHDPERPDVHRKWQVPGGGMEAGETPEQTLAREMKEELDVIPQIIFPYPMVRRQIYELPRFVHINLICYLITIGNQIITVDQTETLDYKWIKPEEITTLTYLPNTDWFIREAHQILTEYEPKAMLQ